MDLWIRSQDRKTLKKVKEVYICKVLGHDKWQVRADYLPDLYENSGEYYLVLGTYKSEKRALEILDKIENVLIINTEGDGKYEQLDLYIKSIMVTSICKVYEMPKE